MDLKNNFYKSSKLIRGYVENNEEKLIKVINKIVKTIKNGNKIMICGNGGSAADAQHFAAELSGKFKHIRKPLPAIALTTNTSAITAIGNDFGFEYIFERQVEAIGKKGDLLIGISTSGNSENVLMAVKKAKELGIVTVGLFGNNGGKMKEFLDYKLIVDSNDTPKIQECHLVIYHTICEEIEKVFL